MTSMSKSESQKAAAPKPTEIPMTSQVPVMSRPSSAPLIPGPRPTAPVVSLVQTAPLLARAVSAVGRLGPDPPASSYVPPQSYRNAIMANQVASCSVGFTHPMYIPQSSERIEHNSVLSGLPFGMVTRDTLPNAPQWMESSQRDGSRSMHSDPSLLGEIQNLDKSMCNGSREPFSMEFPAGTSGRQMQGVLAEEFPHLDIINDLLDEKHNVGGAARGGTGFHSLGNGLNRHLSFPSNMGMSGEMGSSSSPCSFERAQSYPDEGFRRGYSSSSGNHFDKPREFIPQASPLPYANGQIDGLVPTQWPMASSDLPLLSMNVYPHYSPEYSNMACGVNGYTVFRPSNGH